MADDTKQTQQQEWEKHDIPSWVVCDRKQLRLTNELMLVSPEIRDHQISQCCNLLATFSETYTTHPELFGFDEEVKVWRHSDLQFRQNIASSALYSAVDKKGDVMPELIQAIVACPAALKGFWTAYTLGIVTEKPKWRFDIIAHIRKLIQNHFIQINCV